MRAIVARQLGRPDVLQIESIPAPDPGQGCVLVKLAFVGVNFYDTERRRGLHRTPALPWVPGNEASGVVVAVGEGVDARWLDARVAFWSFDSSGAYAEFATCPVESLFQLPDGVGLDVAAALPVQALTAYCLVHYASSLRAGQRALVHAAAGGVGNLLVQMLLARGVRVFGTASNAAKLELIRAGGAVPLAYGSDLALRLRALGDVAGVDAVFDSVGMATQKASLSVLSLYGHLIFYGDSGGRPLPVDPDALYARSLKISSFGLAAHPPGGLAKARADLIEWVADGQLRVRIGDVFPLAAAAHAHRLLEERQTQGKLLLRPTL